MVPVVFIVGRPGSGKSQIARCITGEAWFSGESRQRENCLSPSWTARRFTDYTFLLDRFQQEQYFEFGEGRSHFEKSEYGGFRVTDFSVLREALEKINREICNIQEPRTLVIAEFARDNYDQEVWRVFASALISRAHFMYVETDIDMCMERVKKRVQNKHSEDDAFVPADIINGYYQQERSSDLTQIFGAERVAVISNNGGWAETWNVVKQFLHELGAKCFQDVLMV